MLGGCAVSIDYSKVERGVLYLSIYGLVNML